MHVAAALMNVGQRVATIDLDSRQKSFTRYVEFRRDWAKRKRLDLRIPTHACMGRGSTLKLDENEAIEAAQFADAISAIEQNHVSWSSTQEVLRLLDGLKLPLNGNGRRRSAARQEWFAALRRPLEVHDFIGA